MIFFKHSLITITILVIAISVMPAIADVEDARNYCKTILITYCGFQNNETDYITSNGNLLNYPNRMANNVGAYLENIYRQYNMPDNGNIPRLEGAVRNFIRKFSINYTTFLINSVVAQVPVHYSQFYQIYNELLGVNDMALRFTIAMFQYLSLKQYSNIQNEFLYYQRLHGQRNADFQFYSSQVASFMNVYRDYFVHRDNDIFTLFDTKPVEYFCRNVIPNDDEIIQFFDDLVTVIPFAAV